MNIKDKKTKKDTTNEPRNFLESNSVGVSRLFVWFIKTQMIMQKGIKPKIIYQKTFLRIITSSLVERAFMTKPPILI